eukprot:Skav203092  [mRNA]  locus=scaffold447:159402:159806:+ [translate_table: standard]
MAGGRSLQLEDLSAAFKLFGVDLNPDELKWKAFSECKVLGHQLVPLNLKSPKNAALKFPSETLVDLYGQFHDVSNREVPFPSLGAERLAIVAVHPLTRTGEFSDKGKELVSLTPDAAAARYASYLYVGCWGRLR